MANMFTSKPRLLLLIVGVAFHLFYLWSIFDIYFISPLVHGMSPHRSTPTPPAKRLFLIVGDGLRADTTFDNLTHPETGKTDFLAPYLRNIVLNEGTYGISHTRMPTESRPGHIAMIAGFYEDVSAVTKGWKENPVDFDSVLNQTKHTFSFGSPDILPMFAQGASDLSRVETWMYGHEFEDFTASSIELDAFVFDHVDALFENSTRDEKLNDLMHQDQTVFFLHLLGCDTAGHGFRPYSKEYYNNVMYIDEQISKLVAKVNNYYNDDSTAFIFTADHGMSAFGSHGDGHPNNTRTPLIAWGAGVNKPVKNEYPIFDEYTANWNLSDIQRNDVNQADIASLMSYLIGVNYPVNSVGELPLAYIDASEADKLSALYKNALNIVEQYLVKEQEMISTQFYFKPFSKFEVTEQGRSIDSYKNEIESLISQIAVFDQSGVINEELETKAIKLTEELIKNSLDGLYYLTTYNWLLLQTICVLGFIGWITYSFVIFLRLFIVTENTEEVQNLTVLGLISAVGLALNYLLYYQKSPMNHYAYLLFPLFFWNSIINNFSILSSGFKEIFKGLSILKMSLILLSIFAVFECIVIGFTERWIFAVLLGLLGLLYPASLGIYSISANFIWILTCAGMSTYTLFDAVKRESLDQINISGALIGLSAVVAWYWILSDSTKIKGFPVISSYTKTLIALQISMIGLILVVLNKSITSIQNREGLPFDCQVISWVIFVVSLFVLPSLHFISPHNDYKIRLLIIYLTFAPVFILLTISFESFFYLNFTLLLLQWCQFETTVYKQTRVQSHLQLLRVSVVGFFFLQICFFGCGNVSSISSFSLESVVRLLPVFDPFPMGALLMLKLITPYVLLSTALGVLNVKLGIKKYTISTLIISISDILSLNFFFLLKTEGSWLDIGLTISNYCLAILSSLFMLILELVSNLLLMGVKYYDIELESVDGAEEQKKEK
ncbi:hypothetical protein WICPIJ_005371 [Wickerhamomyces pijperi]|uniref:GPI ethanolamine phosphate transferase 1 n=1 Tax=Wickerhamomyces pijperi TaxID=599730 RepID=A0A9P8Q3S6_WICPI|nr:hypothetical protein WICPIJ_005371 [Wickerhamomyces pijperi]